MREDIEDGTEGRGRIADWRFQISEAKGAVRTSVTLLVQEMGNAF